MTVLQQKGTPGQPSALMHRESAAVPGRTRPPPAGRRGPGWDPTPCSAMAAGISRVRGGVGQPAGGTVSFKTRPEGEEKPPPPLQKEEQLGLAGYGAFADVRSHRLLSAELGPAPYWLDGSPSLHFLGAGRRPTIGARVISFVSRTLAVTAAVPLRRQDLSVLVSCGSPPRESRNSFPRESVG